MPVVSEQIDGIDLFILCLLCVETVDNRSMQATILCWIVSVRVHMCQSMGLYWR